MGLLNRLAGDEEPKLPIHQFTAMMAVYMRGWVTAAQAEERLGLSAAEAQTLANWIGKIPGQFTRQEIDDLLILLEGDVLDENGQPTGQKMLSKAEVATIIGS